MKTIFFCDNGDCLNSKWNLEFFFGYKHTRTLIIKGTIAVDCIYHIISIKWNGEFFFQFMDRFALFSTSTLPNYYFHLLFSHISNLTRTSVALIVDRSTRTLNWWNVWLHFQLIHLIKNSIAVDGIIWKGPI